MRQKGFWILAVVLFCFGAATPLIWGPSVVGTLYYIGSTNPAQISEPSSDTLKILLDPADEQSSWKKIDIYAGDHATNPVWRFRSDGDVMDMLAYSNAGAVLFQMGESTSWSGGGGGGASTDSVTWMPHQLGVDATSPALYVWSPTHRSSYLLFSDSGSTGAIAYVQWKCPSNWDGGNIYLMLVFTTATGESGNIQWGGRVMAVTPGTDEVDYDTDSFDSPTTVIVGVSTTAGYPCDPAELRLANKDSMAAKDTVFIMIYRDIDTEDTLSGDAELRMIELEFGRI